MAADLQQPRFDVLDLWSAPDGIAAEVAFDAGVEAAPSAVWRLDLPAGRTLARARLQAAQASLDEIAWASAQAGPRLQRLSATQTASAGLAFDAAASLQLPAAERDLLAMVGTVAPDQDKASFGLLDRLPLPTWEQASAKLQRLLEQAQHLTTHFAWVETTIEGRLIGRTTVDWLGGMRTLWLDGVDAEMQRRHDASLRLSLATRVATLRLLAVVAAGAATLTPLLVTPGSVLLALPAAWRFVQRLRAEFEMGHG